MKRALDNDGRDLSENACRDKALRLLERKPLSVHDLELKLRQRSFSKAVIATIIADFQRVGLLDDAELARNYCAFKRDSGTPVGRRKVENDLRRHGIPSAVIGQVLEEVWDAGDPAMEEERAVNAARGKLRFVKPGTPRPKIQAKLYRFLAGRGFNPSVCRGAVDRLINDIDYLSALRN